MVGGGAGGSLHGSPGHRRWYQITDWGKAEMVCDKLIDCRATGWVHPRGLGLVSCELDGATAERETGLDSERHSGRGGLPS